MIKVKDKSYSSPSYSCLSKGKIIFYFLSFIYILYTNFVKLSNLILLTFFKPRYLTLNNLFIFYFLSFIYILYSNFEKMSNLIILIFSNFQNYYRAFVAAFVIVCFFFIFCIYSIYYFSKKVKFTERLFLQLTPQTFQHILYPFCLSSDSR